MDKEKRSKVLGKVKKLLALGMKHEESEEGKSALDKAKSLMAEFDIRFIDVEEDGTVDISNIGFTNIPWHRYRNGFETSLMGHISTTLDCSYVIMNKGTKHARHVIYGTETDMELASWLFKFIRLQCYQLAKKSGFTGKDLRTYFFGMHFALKDRITDTFGTVESDVRSTEECTALIVVKKAVAVQARDLAHPNIRKGRKARPLTGSFDAYTEGQNDGNKVSLNRQVNGDSKSSQIGGVI